MAKKRNAGFTLIEMMITVAITGILAAIATPMYIKYTFKARQVEATTNLGAIRTAEIAFKSDRDYYLDVRAEPDLVGSNPTGLKKSWPRFAALPRGPQDADERSGTPATGTFQNIGFEPTGEVYFHYGCTHLGDTARCEATSDLDADQRAQVYIMVWALDVNSPVPNGTFTLALAVQEFGTVYNATPGQF